MSLPEAEFAAWVTERLEEIEKQEAASKPEAREVLKKELVLLEDEYLLLQNREGVLNYLRQSKISKIYDKAIRELDFRGLSTKLGELIKETSTPELQSSFGSELDTMGGGHLKISFGTAGTSGGQTKHKIQFHPGTAERAKIAAILSEGEQRVIALAGFMAELALEGNSNPIVFDDPVTSLDHMFREKIAFRLAKESVARQVIVFTHDIAFLMRLEYWAQAAKASCRPLTVERTGQIIGNWKEGKPWHAMKAPEKIALIRKEFNVIGALPSGSEYNEKVMNLYGKLRESWESIVEDVLFHSVVRRHQKEVLISQLRYICFDDNDHEEFQQSYTKCSDFFAGHSHSVALDANMPVPSEVTADIKKAEDFISRIEANQKAKEKQRKQPVTAQIG